MTNTLIKLFIAIVVISVLSFFVFCGFLGKQLANPARRDLQPYHQNLLQQPADMGVRIQSAKIGFLEIPVLCIEPDNTKSPGKRGAILRDEMETRGVLVPAFGEIRGTMVLLHGRKGRKEDLIPVAARFCAVGFRCIIPDLPAHGNNPTSSVGFGWGKNEANFPSAVLELASKEWGFIPGDSYLWGMSMGGAFSIKDASRADSSWNKMILVCTFDELDNVVRNWARVPKPVQNVVTSCSYPFTTFLGGVSPKKVRSIDLVGKITTPTMVVHGTSDDLIPVDQGQRIYDQLLSLDKKFIEVPGANHGNVLVTEYPIFANMAEWLLQ